MKKQKEYDILNLGCSYNHIKDAWNIDIDPECKPDQIVDLEKPLPFKDEQFEEIVSDQAFEHLINIKQLIRECRRILKPNGRIEITVPYHGTLKNLLIALLYFDFHYDPVRDHIRFFTKNSLSSLIRYGGGFTIKHIKYNGRIKWFANTITIYASKC